MTVAARAEASPRAPRALDAINFFLADVRDGLGPYLAIYLLTVQHWNAATIGAVLSVGGIAAILAQTPAGAFIDATRYKRLVLVVAAVAITAASLAIPLSSSVAVIGTLQAVSGVAGAIFPPALAAVTLGIVGPKAFARRVGRNEAFNHAGNAVAAGLAAGSAYVFGPIAVFWLMAVMAVLSIVATLAVPAEAIDHDLARGLDEAAAAAEASGKPAKDAPSGFSVLLGSRPLMIFALCAVLFHFANAAMLPLVGQKLSLIVGKEFGTTLVAICIVAAQIVMVPMAILVGNNADRWGRKPIFLVGVAVLAARGALYPLSDNPYWLVLVQCLDGVGAGIFGALFPLIIADLTRGTGHFNVSQGAVTAIQGIGASLSTFVAGVIVVQAGYSAAFLFLAAVAVIAFVVFLLAMPESARNAGTVHGADPEPAPAPAPA